MAQSVTVAPQYKILSIFNRHGSPRARVKTTEPIELLKILKDQPGPPARLSARVRGMQGKGREFQAVVAGHGLVSIGSQGPPRQASIHKPIFFCVRRLFMTMQLVYRAGSRTF